MRIRVQNSTEQRTGIRNRLLSTVGTPLSPFLNRSAPAPSQYKHPNVPEAERGAEIYT